MHVTDELVAGRDFGAMESRPLSDRNQESWEQPSCNEGAVGERSDAKKQS